MILVQTRNTCTVSVAIVLKKASGNVNKEGMPIFLRSGPTPREDKKFDHIISYRTFHRGGDVTRRQIQMYKFNSVGCHFYHPPARH